MEKESTIVHGDKNTIPDVNKWQTKKQGMIILRYIQIYENTYS